MLQQLISEFLGPLMKYHQDRITQKKVYEHSLWKFSKIFRLQFWFLATRADARILSYIYLLATCFITVMSLGIAARFCSVNLIFPSLGPTIFMQFYAPSSPMSSPKNTILGHLIGCIVGLLFYWITIQCGSIPGTISLKNVAILGAAVGICGTVMGLTGLLHPPAASTTLLITFGYLGNPLNILAFIGASIFISMEAWLVHKSAGVKFPLWAPKVSDVGPQLHTKLGRLHISKNGCELSVEEIAARLASRQQIK